MNRRTWKAWLAPAAIGLGLAAAGREARAQFPMARTAPAATTSGAGATVASPLGGTMGVYANPYMNPYMNPFVNPYATQNPTSAGNAALFFMASQRMNGGIGSGRLGGPNAVDPRAGLKGKQAVNPNAPDPAARPGNANVPGATASRYFSRVMPSRSGTRTYYNRSTGHFPAVGR